MLNENSQELRISIFRINLMFLQYCFTTCKKDKNVLLTFILIILVLNDMNKKVLLYYSLFKYSR